MGSPHTRGDGPAQSALRAFLSKFSPHAWGWSAVIEAGVRIRQVLPTRVGMVRRESGRRSRSTRSPHTRGDGPLSEIGPGAGLAFSPHAWGWSGGITP